MREPVYDTPSTESRPAAMRQLLGPPHSIASGPFKIDAKNLRLAHGENPTKREPRPPIRCKRTRPAAAIPAALPSPVPISNRAEAKELESASSMSTANRRQAERTSRTQPCRSGACLGCWCIRCLHHTVGIALCRAAPDRPRSRTWRTREGVSSVRARIAGQTLPGLGRPLGREFGGGRHREVDHDSPTACPNGHSSVRRALSK